MTRTGNETVELEGKKRPLTLATPLARRPAHQGFARTIGNDRAVVLAVRDRWSGGQPDEQTLALTG